MSDQATLAEPTPTAAQLAYRMAVGSRYQIGYPASGISADIDARKNVSVITAGLDWVEFHFEDRDGKPIIPACMVKTNVFRASIISAMTPRTREETEQRSYR